MKTSLARASSSCQVGRQAGVCGRVLSGILFVISFYATHTQLSHEDWSMMMMPMDGIAKMILPAVMHGPWVRGGSGIVRVVVACGGTALDTKTIVKQSYLDHKSQHD